MNKANSIVVIPVYKNKMTKYEEISLKQCIHVLQSHDIALVVPDQLDTSKYLEIGGNLKVQSFKKEYFQNIKRYNQLMMSVDFYRVFSQYDFMLVYQLDGFVFSDRLSEFISLDYDYVGAPWFDGKPCYKHTFKGAGRLHRIFPLFNVPTILYVGNGGVSLRNIKRTAELLKKYSEEVSQWTGSEDMFFSFMGKWHSEDYRIPEKEIAVNFSFETELELCWRMTKENLPFACHAWEKYDIAFWRPIFKRYGYDI